jgi:hypothetical protein
MRPDPLCEEYFADNFFFLNILRNYSLRKHHKTSTLRPKDREGGGGVPIFANPAHPLNPYPLFPVPYSLFPVSLDNPTSPS